MRRALTCAAVIAAFALPVRAAAGASVAAPVSLKRTCGAGYVHAYLPWGEKCLRAGEFCKVGNRAYRRYGFYCPPTGHLRRR
jgi:hypothetical protein